MIALVAIVFAFVGSLTTYFITRQLNNRKMESLRAEMQRQSDTACRTTFDVAWMEGKAVGYRKGLNNGYKLGKETQAKIASR